MPSGWRLTSLGSEVSQDELAQVADELLEHAENKTIWLFFGEMGSGKTTLIKAIARRLGVLETMSSPTFSLVNEYAAQSGRVYHVDLYRLRNEQEVIDIGMEDFLNSGAYCFVEWPEKMGRWTPTVAMQVRLTTMDALHRKIEYQTV